MQYTTHRQIKFNGRFSMLDFGVYIGSEIDTDTRREKARPRIAREKIPFMNGSYDFSRLTGDLIYDDQKLYYTFIISEKTKELVAQKADKLDEWLSGDSDELYDSEYPGWKFVGVSYEGMSEIQYYSYNETQGKVTVEFTAAPYMRSRSGQIIDCLTFTPNADPTTYLFAAYMSEYDLVRLKGLGSSGYTDLSISFETVSPQSGIHYAVAEIPQSGAPKWYLLPKSMGGMDITMREPASCVCIKEDADYYYLYQATTTAVSVQLWGFDYDTYTEAQLEAIIKHADWRLTDDVQSFPQSSVPSTRDMRVISEGTPTLSVNGNTADTAGFPLSVGDLLTVGSAQDELCKLQYCTVKERR